jgi:hypothetical protein
MAYGSYSARVPAKVAKYFNNHPVIGSDWAHPIIVREFTPGVGWRRLGFNKRISVSWCRKRAKEGVTAVAVTAPGTNIEVDFNIREVTR